VIADTFFYQQLLLTGVGICIYSGLIEFLSKSDQLGPNLNKHNNIIGFTACNIARL